VRQSFRTRIFIGSVVTATVSLVAAAILLTWQEQAREVEAVEQRLVAEARLIASLIESPALAARDVFDEDAHAFGSLVNNRVTFVAADGRVVGDSTLSPAERAAVDNHGARPEIAAARQAGVGYARRYSTTVETDMLYVAVPARHRVVAFVRVAMPLTALNAQLSTVQHVLLVALGVGVPLALIAAWIASRRVGREVQAIARLAARYAAGDISGPKPTRGPDELGTVAEALDVVAQELGTKVEDLSRDRARIDAILAGMVEGVLVVDRQGRLQRTNAAATTMLDIDSRAIGQRYVSAIRHPDIVSALEVALAGTASQPLEFSLPREASRMFVARAAPVPASRGGGAVLVLHDISDIRRVDRMRQDFVANVSHELRTPLTAIRGYAEVLADTTTASNETRRYAEIITRHATRMQRLVTDLLRLARLDAKQEALELALCDLGELISDVVRDQAEAAARKHQRVTIDVSAAPSVTADPGKLHDIVRNLVENAVNYTPEHGVIHVHTERRDRATAIVVTDNGPGIPVDEVDRVFERFYRVDKSRARPGGTGLGLAIVRHLTELHGGRAMVANVPTGGASFTIELPDSPQEPDRLA
jgi:two-component system phosphate regulon sensor histidine kinase PhoR